MVGDSTHDLRAGRAAGMRTVAVLTGLAGADELAPLSGCCAARCVPSSRLDLNAKSVRLTVGQKMSQFDRKLRGAWAF